ncbi:MAG TPA: hypothetical protein VJY35_10595 [Candidatus Eisenbacteria bacterium]|nr:hypothetical protein [Candidatus Eisenbacteria bacterium]
MKPVSLGRDGLPLLPTFARIANGIEGAVAAITSREAERLGDLSTPEARKQAAREATEAFIAANPELTDADRAFLRRSDES